MHTASASSTPRERDIDTLEDISCIPHLSRAGFPPALIHRRRREARACLIPAIHPDADFAGTRGCGTARRDRSRIRSRIHVGK